MGYGKIMELVVFKNIAIMDPVVVARLARWAEDFEREQIVRKLKGELKEWRAIQHFINYICDCIRDKNKEKTDPQIEDIIANYKTQDPYMIKYVARSTEIENSLRNHVPSVEIILGKSMSQLIIEYDNKARVKYVR